MKPRLPICIVHSGKVHHTGFLFMENERVVILLNNIVAGAELGLLQNIRYEHIEPEADIFILPRSQVDSIELIGELNDTD
jgi:hypothetical protein